MQDPWWVEKERERGRIKMRKASEDGRSKEWSFADRLRRHGLTLEQYGQMKETQCGVCAICSQRCDKGGELSIDHNHETGEVRALLCRNCNAGLGYFKENSSALLAAALYLKYPPELPWAKEGVAS